MTAAWVHALSPQRRLAQFGQQSWQSDSGLPQNSVHAVLQTSDGYLWIATEGGLVRFDGVSFRVYDTENTPQLRSDIINDLKEDHFGVLWISTTAGLVREQAGSFKLFGVADGLPSGEVSSTFLTSHGFVLALTPGGVAVLRGEVFAKLPGSEDLQPIGGFSSVVEDKQGQVRVAGSGGVFTISADMSRGSLLSLGPDAGEPGVIAAAPTGEIWVSGRRGIRILQNGSWTRLTQRDGLPSDDVLSLLPDRSGGMWIGTSRGLVDWKDGALPSVSSAQIIAGATVEQLYRDREGAVWAATSRGLARIANGQMELMPRRSRIVGVLSIFEDREGSMWFGTDTAGLIVVREQAFSTIAEQDGLSAAYVRALFQDADGTIWIGTNGGGVDRIVEGKVSPLVVSPAMSSGVILSLAKTGRDLWVGTPNGLNRIRDGRTRVFTTEDGLADDFVRSLYADRDGSLWIGTRNGLSHLVADAFTSYSRMDGLGGDLIGAILRTTRGDLWVGTLGGLSRLNGNSFVTLTKKDGLGADAVTSLMEGSGGALWAGTQDGGLSRLSAGRIATFAPAATGLPETIFGILEDTTGHLWLSSRKGIYRVSTSELRVAAGRPDQRIAVRVYGVADGMRISEASSGGHPAAWRMNDGSLWFATLDGVAAVTPESVAANILPPSTAIEQVLIDDQPLDLRATHAGDVVIVPSGPHRITVQYAGLSFVAPQKVRYRYMLQGFDRDWVDAGVRRAAYYTNIPPGRYRFLVMSANSDGVWSAASSGFALQVRPTVLQTRWFYALLLMLAAMLATAIYRWRVHTVQARYEAVLQERGRIAREIHDTLAQGYVAISVQLELTARLLQSSKEAALHQLEETKELVRGSLAEARSSIWNLRSSAEAGTLPSLLAAMTESKASSDGPAFKLEVKGTYRAVSRSVEQELLRIAQEAVANAVRHAGAKHVNVTLRYDSSTLQLRVADDGNGFDDVERDLSQRGHFGLKGMRERAAKIGAWLKVESTLGQGTAVDLRMDSRKAERKDLL